MDAALAFVTTRTDRYKQNVFMLIFLTLLFDDFSDISAQHPPSLDHPVVSQRSAAGALLWLAGLFKGRFHKKKKKKKIDPVPKLPLLRSQFDGLLEIWEVTPAAVMRGSKKKNV